jgi:hypothetical protein
MTEEKGVTNYGEGKGCGYIWRVFFGILCVSGICVFSDLSFEQGEVYSGYAWNYEAGRMVLLFW